MPGLLFGNDSAISSFKRPNIYKTCRPVVFDEFIDSELKQNLLLTGEEMSKNKKQGKKSKQSGSRPYSSLAQHELAGKTLRPPFRKLDKVKLTSWQDDHLPAMIWAALLTEKLSRQDYLDCFRRLISHCAPWFVDGGLLDQRTQTSTHVEHMNFSAILDFDSLARLPDEHFKGFFDLLVAHPLGRSALRPLLRLNSPPGIARWHKLIACDPAEEDWGLLAGAVARCLDHQSESSTDIRWLKLAVPITAGRMRFGSDFDEHVREILDFPNRGDLRSVRPSIRAAEVAIRRNPTPNWVRLFWDECVRSTACIDPTDIQVELKRHPSNLDPRMVFGCRGELSERFFQVKSSERVDARLDAVFGLTLYALSLVTTLAATRTQETMLGRLALRSLVEARITLAFLASRDEPKLWNQWRVYGSGQVKLAFLKAQESSGDIPSFYSPEELEQLANEDIWQEYLDIDLGHWTKANLRWMASEAGEKELYDKFYGWSSGFVHAQWGAIRDTDYVTCHNPLHRLHRIPRAVARRQASVEMDAVELVNGMLEMVDRLYPGESKIHLLKCSSDAKDEEG